MTGNVAHMTGPGGSVITVDQQSNSNPADHSVHSKQPTQHLLFAQPTPPPGLPCDNYTTCRSCVPDNASEDCDWCLAEANCRPTGTCANTTEVAVLDSQCTVVNTPPASMAVVDSSPADNSLPSWWWIPLVVGVAVVRRAAFYGFLSHTNRYF